MLLHCLSFARTPVGSYFSLTNLCFFGICLKQHVFFIGSVQIDNIFWLREFLNLQYDFVHTCFKYISCVDEMLYTSYIEYDVSRYGVYRIETKFYICHT